MNRILKILFFALIVKPVVFIVMGVNIHNREKLPSKGPAILAANHNSHMDTMVLMSLYPLSQIHKIRPVAAMDYFFSNRFLAWLTMRCIGIIPLDRSGKAGKNELFSGCHQALDEENILIVFPEGSRGEPEQLGRIKKGLYHLIQNREDVPVIPVALHGMGRALPKGEALFVPFICDAVVGDPLTKYENSTEFNNAFVEEFNKLQENCLTKNELDDE